MGTNYYAKGIGCGICDHTGGMHIGKSSAGWKFLFHLYRTDYWDLKGEHSRKPNLYSDLETLKEFLKNKKIMDEYGTEITNDEFFIMVENKQGLKSHENDIPSLYVVNGYEFYESDFS